MKKVMFACRKNSCRSQIAEGFAKTLGAGKIAVTSSGLEAANPMWLRCQSAGRMGFTGNFRGLVN